MPIVGLLIGANDGILLDFVLMVLPATVNIHIVRINHILRHYVSCGAYYK